MSGRNDRLASVGGGLRAQGLEFNEILDALLNHPYRDGLSENEVRGIAKSVCKYPAGTSTPRQTKRRPWTGALPTQKSEPEKPLVLARETYKGFRPSAIYYYNLADGSPAYRKLRFEAGTLDRERKQFRFEHFLNGSWYEKRGPFAGSLYRLEQFARRRRVFIVEGEKCADLLWDYGLLATCNDSGAGEVGKGSKWPVDLNQHFVGKEVIVFPDNDDPGRAHAELVRSNLIRFADSVRTVTLPDLPAKGDVYDWLEGALA